MHNIAPVDTSAETSAESTSGIHTVQIALTIAAVVCGLIALAALATIIGSWVWIACAAAAIAVGLGFGPDRRGVLVLALIPATLLTNSALVPHGGRYVPAVTVIGALFVASRADLPQVIARARSLSPLLRWLLVAYIAWMAVTTLTSIQRGTSATYVIGSAVTLGLAFLLVPSLRNRSRLVEQILATVSITGVVIVLSGVVLWLLGSFTLYGGHVGLYFITEATLFGHPTGLLSFQDYGPFVGPETTPLGIGLAGSVYLAAHASGRARLLWIGAAAVILLGLLTTYSREGWLIVLIICGALAVFSRGTSPVKRPAVAVAVVMLIVFAGGITSVIGVLGRVDLTTAWYGPSAASVLLNPNPAQRGQSQSPGSTNPSGPVQQRTLSQPCVAEPSSGAAAGSTVQLKGSSSLLARLCLWETGLKAIADRPLFGFGPGTGTQAIIPFFEGLGASSAGATTHQTYLRIGVEMGVPGMLIYIALSGVAVWLAFVCLRSRRDRPENILAASVLAISVAELTDTLLFGGLSFPGFWLAMSVGLLATPSALAQEVRTTEPVLIGRPAPASPGMVS